MLLRCLPSRELPRAGHFAQHIWWRPLTLPRAAQIGPFSDADSLPQWAIALIVMGSCITLAIVMVLIAKAMHYYNLIMSPGALLLCPMVHNAACGVAVR